MSKAVQILVTFIVLAIQIFSFYSLFIFPIETVAYVISGKIICPLWVNLLFVGSAVLNMIFNAYNSEIESFLKEV